MRVVATVLGAVMAASGTLPLPADTSAQSATSPCKTVLTAPRPPSSAGPGPDQAKAEAVDRLVRRP